MLASEDSNRKSIAEHFEELSDPRPEVNREHLLVDVIVISIGAILAGVDGPTAIVDSGGDYVLPVKGNQGGLEQAVTEFFADHLEDDFARVKVSRLESTKTHHGRIEKRSYFQVNVPDDLPGRPRWKGLRTLGLVIRTREVNGRETDDIQCSISSLKRNVKLFAKAARGHWGIENTCHWTLDMTFREDESRTRDRHLCENLAWLRRFALGLLKQHPNTKTSLAMKRRQAGWCVSFLSEVLFNSTT